MSREEMSKKRTHKCHKCPKEYNKTSHLRAHLRAHDNYRPYVCDFKTCGKSFTRSDELKRHKRIHNDDRNFPCHICNKKFLRSDHLNKHLLVHNKSSASSASQASAALTIRDENGQIIKQESVNSLSSAVSNAHHQIIKLIEEQQNVNLNPSSSVSSLASSASSSAESPPLII